MESHPKKPATSNSAESAQRKPRFLQRARMVGATMLQGGEAKRSQSETIGAGRIKNLADSLPRMKQGEKRYLHGGHMVESEYPDGPRGIMGIALVGDAAIAIVQEYPVHVQKQGKSPRIKLVELPYGEHAGESERTGKILAEIDPDTLNKPRDNGTVQPWERITLGRTSEDPSTMGVTTDSTASRKHVAIDINAQGTVELTDLSMNGTALITGETLATQQNPELNALYSHLANPDNSLAWNTPFNSHALVARGN